MELGWGKVLLVKDNGEFHALGHKCPHYGAPLVKGELSGSPEVGLATAPLSPSAPRPSPAWLLPGPPVPRLLVGSLGRCGRDTGNLGEGLLQVTPAPPPRRAVPGPGALPLAWRLLQHQHRGPGGLPWPGQSAQVPGGAGCGVGRSLGVQGQGLKRPEPGSEPPPLAGED